MAPVLLGGVRGPAGVAVLEWGDDALVQADRERVALPPELAVIALDLADLDGRRVAAAVARDAVPAAVVVLAAEAGPDGFDAVAGGAQRCVSKRAGAEGGARRDPAGRERRAVSAASSTAC